LNVIEAGVLLKPRTSCAVGDFVRLGWTMLWLEARQAEATWELAWTMEILKLLLGLRTWVDVWRNCKLSSERKNTGPHQIPTNDTHIPAPEPHRTTYRHSSNWHL